MSVCASTQGGGDGEDESLKGRDLGVQGWGVLRLGLWAMTGPAWPRSPAGTEPGATSPKSPALETSHSVTWSRAWGQRWGGLWDPEHSVEKMLRGLRVLPLAAAWSKHVCHLRA